MVVAILADWADPHMASAGQKLFDQGFSLPLPIDQVLDEEILELVLLGEQLMAELAPLGWTDSDGAQDRRKHAVRRLDQMNWPAVTKIEAATADLSHCEFHDAVVCEQRRPYPVVQ
jgi:hypothetical protein